MCLKLVEACPLPPDQKFRDVLFLPLTVKTIALQPHSIIAKCAPKVELARAARCGSLLQFAFLGNKNNETYFHHLRHDLDGSYQTIVASLAFPA